MKKLLILSVIFIFTMSFGQDKKTEKYFYKVANPQKNRYDTTIYTGFDYEFSYIREYIKDSIFIEKKLFGHTDTFEIKNERWYLYLNGNKIPFCSENNFKKKKPQKWDIVYLIPSEIIKTQSGENLYVYTISTDVNVTDCCTDLFFDPKRGFVKIRFNNFALDRTP